MLPVGLCAQLACIWEVTARKPGNVHRYQDFADLTYMDFVLSAAAIAPVLETATERRVGDTILEGIRATRRLIETNANLGILLLLAPLAAVPREQNLRGDLQRILADLDRDDARVVYEAIRLARPGAMGTVPDQDVSAEPTQTLLHVMSLAAHRDLIARQYVSGFRDVFDEGVSALNEGLESARTLEGAILACHLRLMASYPDSLIARKRGAAEAEESSRRAHEVLNQGWPHRRSGWEALRSLDAWLRAEGHSRNPGTTADLVTASLFIALRQGTIEVPCRTAWFAEPCHG
jgi:triphosphoribosyl-dephospho-CoA synthase